MTIESNPFLLPTSQALKRADGAYSPDMQIGYSSRMLEGGSVVIEMALNAGLIHFPKQHLNQSFRSGSYSLF